MNENILNSIDAWDELSQPILESFQQPDFIPSAPNESARECAERIQDWCTQQQCPVNCEPLFAFVEGASRPEIELDAIVDLFVQCDRVVERIEAFARVRGLVQFE